MPIPKTLFTNYLNKQVTVLDYRTAESKFSRSDYLQLQIEYEGKTYVIFTGSGVLKDDLDKLDNNAFPFTTTIVKIPFKEKQFFFKFT